MQTHKINVSIVTFPLGQASYTPLSNLINLFSQLANRVYAISGDAALENINLDFNVQTMRVTHKVNSVVIMRIINYIHTQLKILCLVLIVSRKVDVFVFFIGGEDLFIPMFALKLLRKRVILMPGGATVKGYFARKDPLAKSMSMLVRINFSLADRLIVYSHNLAREANLLKYEHKIIYTHEHFVDFAYFMVKKKIDERKNLVGYIGRLGKEKGILNFLETIVLLPQSSCDFLIGGDGELRNNVDEYLKIKNLSNKVKLTGWIPHKDLPLYLNELKLIVLPSYTEGLPNILLEAMACGTPILATPVGAIPDIIKEGKTGFLLKTNDPKHISERIIELLDKPELLEKVSANAYKYVKENFSYEKTMGSWRKIFDNLN